MKPLGKLDRAFAAYTAAVKERVAAADHRFKLYLTQLDDAVTSCAGLPEGEHKAPKVGRSNEGKPGTRKTRYGKTQRKWGR